MSIQLGEMNSPGILFTLLLTITLLTACTEDILPIKQRCSQNGTYCEDVRQTNGQGTVYTNATPLLDARDPTNYTFYEELTP